MSELTPKQITVELDKYIIGQDDAKKAVAIALRNRWRRKQVQGDLQDEIVPKNILMIGPTGCGKTEIARRLARLADAPFIKVEATKFTEVGYVGRDVESIIRDLVEISVKLFREKEQRVLKEKASEKAVERILDALVGDSASSETRKKFAEKLEKGELDDKEIEIEVSDSGDNPFNNIDIPGLPGASMGVINMGEMFGKAFGNKTKRRKMTVEESRKILIAEELDKLVDHEKLVQSALKAVENDGIVFIDEIDKVCARSDVKGGEVSREGVQRDLLPLIEGTIVSTKHGTVKTDHILFITSGAFHMAKPSDLLPELQGRLPIRVELKPLSEADMERILTEPEASLTKQYVALLATENVKIQFADDGVKALAALATKFNKEIENIGARRLHTIMEKLLEELSYNADEMQGEDVIIDSEYVANHVGNIVNQMDLSKFIL
jgi:ATP-dependent HslUV protease ATP-binding subunit HslU